MPSTTCDGLRVEFLTLKRATLVSQRAGSRQASLDAFFGALSDTSALVRQVSERAMLVAALEQLGSDDVLFWIAATRPPGWCNRSTNAALAS